VDLCGSGQVAVTGCREHANGSSILDNDQLDKHLIYFTIRLYNPLHVSSIIYSSSGGWIILMQHLVSSLSVSGRPVHRTATYLQFTILMMSI